MKQYDCEEPPNTMPLSNYTFFMKMNGISNLISASIFGIARRRRRSWRLFLFVLRAKLFRLYYSLANRSLSPTADFRASTADL